MKLIKLDSPQTIYAIVDDEDYEFLIRYNWTLRNGRCTQYAEAYINRHRVGMHELIKPSDDPLITPDHKNRNGLDNRKNNLRLANKSQQMANRDKYDGKYKYKGIRPNSGGRWSARIRKDHKEIYLGTFNSEIEAALAYNRKAFELFGEFAVLNLIEKIQ